MMEDYPRLYELSHDDKDLEARLKSLGKGIGDTTISIFLRDMREIWPKANPRPSNLVRKAIDRLGITDLKHTAQTVGVSVVTLETALLRLEKDFIKKKRALPISV